MIRRLPALALVAVLVTASLPKPAAADNCSFGYCFSFSGWSSSSSWSYGSDWQSVFRSYFDRSWSNDTYDWSYLLTSWTSKHYDYTHDREGQSVFEPSMLLLLGTGLVGLGYVARQRRDEVLDV